MRRCEIIDYSLAGQTFKGYLAYDSAPQEKREAVLVVPTWMGLNEFIRHQTDALADLGYIGFAVDLFGDGKIPADSIEAKKCIVPLLEDRQRIRDRMDAAFNRLGQHPLVNSNKMAIIGFCFGGMCAIEFAKGGASLRGAVSFHASLGNPHNLAMKPIATAQHVAASILLLHGYKDALAPEKDLLTLQHELSDRGVDWQVVVYGQAMHAFTNPEANHPELSLQYHEKTAKRAWLAMRHFLQEVFQD